ncbi:MAG: PQQ-binding-like beta-propeller repeat protein [Dokdonella sp.]
MTKIHDSRPHNRMVGWPLLGSFLVVLCAMAAAASASMTDKLTEVNILAPGYFAAASLDLPSADFDGDGLADVAILGEHSYTSIIQIIGYSADTGWVVKQSIMPTLAQVEPASERLVTWVEDDGAHLLFLKNRLASEYAGWPLKLVRQIQFGFDFDWQDVKVADVDRDGHFEVIVANITDDGSLRAYSLATGALIWSLPELSMYNRFLLIAQLDADPALEIVLSGSPGLVIDGATHAIEWQVEDGIGYRMRAGNYGGPRPGFASLDYNIQMFRSQPWVQQWQLNDYYAKSAAAADIDGDGVDELIYGTNLPSIGIRVLDVQSRTIRSSFNIEDILTISAEDFDGDGQTEIAISQSPNRISVSQTSFSVIDATSGLEEGVVPAIAPGPYVAGAFVSDGDSTDIIFGSTSGTDWPGALTRADAATGAVRWRSAAAGSSIDLNRIDHVLVTQIVGQAQPIALASGSGEQSNYYGGRIVAVDLESGAPLWNISSESGGLPFDTSVNGIAAIDLDGDSLTDSVLACTSDGRLRLFNAVDQAPIWTSVAMARRCLDVFGLSAGTAGLQLVAVLDGSVRAYDAQTHLLSWSLPSSYLMKGASLIANGEQGPELAVFTDSEITFVDAETREVLRTLNPEMLYPIQAILQPPGTTIHQLLAAVDDKVYVIDGVSGEVRAESTTVGFGAGQFNRLAIQRNADGSYLVGAGSNVAISTHRLELIEDSVFQNGFDPITP